MVVEVKVPSAGESVNEGELVTWFTENGAYVKVDEVIAELETEKASLEIRAPVAGKLSVLVGVGTIVKVGQSIARVEEGVAAPPSSAEEKTLTSPALAEATANTTSSPEQSKPLALDQAATGGAGSGERSFHATPAERKRMRERGLEPEPKYDVVGSDVVATTTQGASEMKQRDVSVSDRGETRKKVSRLRATIARRLVLAQQTGALLTTFNEIDMEAVTALRQKHKEAFKKKFSVGLGYMSFFVRATSLALREFPVLHSRMGEAEIITPHYVDIGIAVATAKGLVVPVLRDADKLRFEEIEGGIKAFALRGSEGKLTIEELSGGTFTITNGGVFGSMLSTPIVNHPQSAILGMHNIVSRPVAVGGEVRIHPVMYVALSYDHRLIDGSDAVRFLVRIKDYIEDPARLLIEI